MQSKVRFVSRVVERTVLGTLLLFLSVQMGQGAGFTQDRDAHELFFPGVCACIHGDTVYRTQFEFMNEAVQPQEGVPSTPIHATLTFFQSDGSPMEVTPAPDWVGTAGTLESDGNEISFSVPSQSTLVLKLLPEEGANLGWARFFSEGPLNPQASLQLAKRQSKPNGSALEDSLLYQATLHPTIAAKSFVLPISFFSGMKQLSTAFTLANLSGVSSKVELTLRPDNTREVVLGPGELLADYFQHFWTVAFPAIYPLDYRGTVEITSEAPLTLSAFKTVNGYPNLGIRPAVVSSATQEPDIEASLDTPFELAVGQVAGVGDLKIEFWNVTEDSRCPTDVQCVWEGRVKIELRLSGADKTETVQLSPISGEDTAQYGGLQIRLLEVNPAPVSTEELETSDYRVQIVVSEK